jgi:hypothetical protein
MQFLDALQILRVLWEAHHRGEVVTLIHLHGVVKLPVDRIEAVLDAMSAVHWTGRVANGWAMIKDAAEITVSDVYRLLVFRPGAELPARRSGQALDRLALEITGGFEANLGLTLEEMFRRATADGQPPGMGEQRSAANVLRLG